MVRFCDRLNARPALIPRLQCVAVLSPCPVRGPETLVSSLFTFPQSPNKGGRRSRSDEPRTRILAETRAPFFNIVSFYPLESDMVATDPWARLVHMGLPCPSASYTGRTAGVVCASLVIVVAGWSVMCWWAHLWTLCSFGRSKRLRHLAKLLREHGSMPRELAHLIAAYDDGAHVAGPTQRRLPVASRVLLLAAVALLFVLMEADLPLCGCGVTTSNGGCWPHGHRSAQLAAVVLLTGFTLPHPSPVHTVGWVGLSVAVARASFVEQSLRWLWPYAGGS